MFIDLPTFVLFAQEAAEGPGFTSMLPALAIIFVLFYLLIIRPERNKQKAHQNLLTSLKKNDRVVTVGGIYGVVNSVNREKDEVVLRVDESNNTRLAVTYGSVARVLSDGAKSEK
ncbi:MAG: preprotein translocase subunit YajC [Pirellulales bacterium]